MQDRNGEDPYKRRYSDTQAMGRSTRQMVVVTKCLVVDTRGCNWAYRINNCQDPISGMTQDLYNAPLRKKSIRPGSNPISSIATCFI